MERNLVPFSELLEHLDRGWFPLWFSLHDETPRGKDLLTVDWVCRWRVPDGKYFCTDSECTLEQKELFNERARAAWQQETGEQFGDITKQGER